MEPTSPTSAPTVVLLSCGPGVGKTDVLLQLARELAPQGRTLIAYGQLGERLRRRLAEGSLP
jgi:predicted ATP-dependent serine protease